MVHYVKAYDNRKWFTLSWPMIIQNGSQFNNCDIFLEWYSSPHVLFAMLVGIRCVCAQNQEW